MKNNTHLKPCYFQLTLFADYGSLRYVFFSVSLLIYLAIMSANVAIVLTVCLEKSLHQPMYIFICCLSLNALYGSAGFFPRFLMDILSYAHFISRLSCFMQVYVIYTYGSYELTILTIMAYDRFVAISQPLHYHSKMTFKMVLYLLILAGIYPVFTVGLLVFMASRLPLCGNKLHRLFCSNWAVVKLSCVDTTLNNIVGMILSLITVFIPMFFVLYTYLQILLICRRSSSEFRGKALQTCLPHIVTFLNFCLSAFCEVSLSRLKPEEVNPFVLVVLSLEFLIVPPLNNPLVYSLNLPQIRQVIFRFLRACKRLPARQHAQEEVNETLIFCCPLTTHQSKVQTNSY